MVFNALYKVRIMIAPVSDFLCLRRKFLVYNLIMRNLKIRYRKSLLGMLWTVVIPAGSAGIFYIVLKNIMRVEQQNHFVLILAAQIAWVFFASSIATGLEVIVNNFGLLNKVPLPPQSLVLAETLTLFLNLLLSLPILLFAMLFLQPPTIAALQYVILIGLLALFSYSFSLLLGLLYAYLRDLKHLMALILQFWFYLTPVLYTESMIPTKMRFILYLNPVGILFASLQAAIRGEFISLENWAVVLAWTCGVTLVAQIYLGYVRNKVVEIA